MLGILKKEWFKSAQTNALSLIKAFWNEAWNASMMRPHG